MYIVVQAWDADGQRYPGSCHITSAVDWTEEWDRNANKWMEEKTIFALLRLKNKEKTNVKAKNVIRDTIWIRDVEAIDRFRFGGWDSY